MFSAIALQVFRLEHGEELMLAELEQCVAFALRGFEAGPLSEGERHVSARSARLVFASR